MGWCRRGGGGSGGLGVAALCLFWCGGDAVGSKLFSLFR